ncbi:MAG: carboxypeptidase regulatory-like domain-containing protein [Deltaproteobacteria bacterium]|nr:carboxypeptidase regulatory-like domain-containing protein [Deltaproteobacteria bacterium]
MTRFGLVLLLAACGGPRSRLYPNGTNGDDGHGELARAATLFIHRQGDDGDDLFTRSAGSGGRGARRERRDGGTEPGDDAAGYGGSTYANYTVPTWQYPTGARTQHYQMLPNLTGSVEGVVAWRGAAPAKVASRCGVVAGPRIAADGGIADVLVYIERVAVGRQVEMENRPPTVGGTLQRRACGFTPAVQVVSPMPAALYVHGNGEPARVRVSPPAGVPRALDLQEGGRIGVQLAPGLTKIDAEDGLSGAAWVLALETPYYALTDDRGRYRIEQLANGTYDLTVWHAPAPSITGGLVGYGPPVVVRRQVKIENGKPARLDVQLR